MAVIAAGDCSSVAVDVVIVAVTLVCSRSDHHHTRLSTLETKSNIFPSSTFTSGQCSRTSRFSSLGATARGRPHAARSQGTTRQSVNVNEVKVGTQQSYDF